MKRTYQENKSLYESIMRDVAKIVKRHLNESDDSYIELEMEGAKYINGALEFIRQHEDICDYFEKAGDIPFIKTRKVTSAATDGKRIFFNPDFMDTLTDKQQAFVIMHQIAHIVMNHLGSAGNMEENVRLDRRVNHFLEDKFPEFRGVTKEINGIF